MGGATGVTAGGAGTGKGGNGGAGAAPGTAGKAGVLCPEQAPAAASSCSPNGLKCEYGDDVRGEACRTSAVCTASTWQVVAPNPSGCPALQNVGACPTPATDACEQDTSCAKPDGTVCRCTNCPPSAPLCGVTAAWYCPTPNPSAGCPSTPPNLGTACDMDGVECGYLQECDQPTKVCSGGVWSAGQILGCPRSTRRAKQDIHYLSAQEVEATAAQTLRLRLATYEYKAAPKTGRHLGFIIEDSPNNPAVDRDGNLVDLYGYTSMLLATTQAQQQKILELEQKLGDLTKTVERLRSH